MAALSLLQRMPMSMADDTTFHAASYACGEAGHWVEALQLLEEMQSRRVGFRHTGSCIFVWVVSGSTEGVERAHHVGLVRTW